MANKTTDYVSWSDARIRGWLRDHGVAVPMRTSRQELLQRMHENCKSSFSVFHKRVLDRELTDEKHVLHRRLDSELWRFAD